jgi:GDPmannose 4,6-dehydratase
MNQIAIVSGLTGMDGSYLADLLIEKGYKVYGIVRRSSRGNDLGCSKHLANNPNLEVVEGDITDLSSLARIVALVHPALYFNCAAQSHVQISFNEPVHTAMATGIGCLNGLEAIRLSGVHTRFLQCSSSELYGGVSPEPANEETPFHPRSPYACAKLFAHSSVVLYREAYNFFACTTICFNHEGPRRGPAFVTRKITLAVARIKHGFQKELFLGNLDAKRDWGSSKDYTEGMYLALTYKEPTDFVLATGETHSVREFCEAAFSHVGLDYKDYVKVDPKFYRPAEVNVLLGDASKAKKLLGWEPKTKFAELAREMVDNDMQLVGENKI